MSPLGAESSQSDEAHSPLADFSYWEWDRAAGEVVEHSESGRHALSASQWFARLTSDGLTPEAREQLDTTRREFPDEGDEYCVEFDTGHDRWVERGVVWERSATGDVLSIRGVTVRCGLSTARASHVPAPETGRNSLRFVASGVAHDFNNLLAAIHGYSHLAREQLEENHPARASLQIIEDAIDQAAGITRSLVTLSDENCAERRRLDLRAVVRDSFRFLKRLLPESVEVREDPALDEIPVEGDRAQLQHLLVSIVMTLRDWLGERPGERSDRVGIRSFVEFDSAVVEITFGDESGDQLATGSLLPADVGLGFVESIASSHGGVIQLSTGSRSRRFRVTLPRIQPTKTSESPTLQGVRLLLAEDDEYVRKILLTALEAEGFRVTAACTGDEALAEFEGASTPFAALVLDIDLPGVSGWECLRRVRAQQPHIPVMIVTGGSLDPSAPADALPPGVEMMNKPFRLPDLVARLSRLIQERVVG